MKLGDIKTNEWLGIDPAVQPEKQLTAGKWALVYTEGRLKNFSFNGQLLVTEIYFALRDNNWGTIPFRIDNFAANEAAGSFRLDFRAVHEQGGIAFEWEGSITGDANSVVSYSFKGKSKSSFLKNRIGMCVLLPSTISGMPCQVEHMDGSLKKGNLPATIEPHQPFLGIKKITVYPDAGTTASIEFEGDEFEMEDQRNWTDASFKIYCTPLSVPFPVAVKSGDTFSQSVSVRLASESEAADVEVREKLNVYALESGHPLCEPKLSLGSCITKALSERQLNLVKALGFTHLRFDYHFDKGDEQLTSILPQLHETGAKLFLAVFFTGNWQKELETIKKLLEKYKEEIDSLIIFQQGVKVITEETLRAIRSELQGMSVRLGSGTNGYFTQINRERLPAECLDFISYSNNPQVHAFDNESIMSTVEGQIANIETCRLLFKDLPIFISPVSMKIRWNPDATGETILRPSQCPLDIDARQVSLFAAAWFLKSIAACAQKDVSGISFFELVGKKGLMEDTKCDQDYYFPSAPDMIYPLYFAFWALRGWGEAKVTTLWRDDLTAITLRLDRSIRAVISNPLAQKNVISISGFDANSRYGLIDETNIALYAAGFTGTFDSGFWKSGLGDTITLAPYSLCVIETDLDAT